MRFKELLYKSEENKQIEEDITNWKNIFIRTIEMLLEGYKNDKGKRYSLKSIYRPNELKLAEVMESFEDDLVFIVFEYKLAFNEYYNGIRECKIFSTFLYHLFRIIPFNNASKDVHIAIFIYILKLISDNTDLKVKDKHIKNFLNKDKFGYILTEKYASIDCIYSVCRQVLFDKADND